MRRRSPERGAPALPESHEQLVCIAAALGCRAASKGRVQAQAVKDLSESHSEVLRVERLSRLHWMRGLAQKVQVGGGVGQKVGQLEVSVMDHSHQQHVPQATGSGAQRV